MELQGLTSFLVGLALGFTITALASPAWGCGNLFTQCKFTTSKAVAGAVAGLILIAGFALLIVLIMWIVTLCKPEAVQAKGWNIGKIVLLAIAAVCYLIALIVFTAKVGQLWAYFVATIALTLTFQVFITELVIFIKSTRNA